MRLSSSVMIASFLPIAARGFIPKQRLIRKIPSLSKMSNHADGTPAKRSKHTNIYLDFNGTTPVYERVLKSMLPFLTDHFGNPSSGHWAGKEPREAVDRARRQILDLLGAHEEKDLSSIWFTSCGTESDNLAIHLALQSAKAATARHEIPHIVTCNVEHPAVELYLKRMEEEKLCRVTYVPVHTDGRVRAEDVIGSIDESTVLVTLMLANNESGALQPVKEVAEYCRKKSILCHTDAAQAAGKVSVKLDDIGGADMVTLVGHKLGAPKGVACLYVRPGCLPDSVCGKGGIMLIGGGQEAGRRGGTENVPYIVGLGEAATIASKELETNAAKMEDLRSRLLRNLENGLSKEIIRVNGPTDPSLRLPNTLSVGLKGTHSGSLLAVVQDRVAASAGASCHSNAEISSVLRAMKVPEEFARGTLRLSVGPITTAEEVDIAADIIVGAAKQQLGA